MSFADRAEQILLTKGVVPDATTSLFYFFKVVWGFDVEHVKISRTNNNHSCTCIHGSYWKGNKDEICFHIRACLMYIKRKMEDKNEKNTN